MTEPEQANLKPNEVAGQGEDAESEDLPYRVTLWLDGDAQKVLARAASVVLARAIFVAALTENPGRRITLSRGPETINDSTKA